ncbi:unnamed protein product, partial [Eruca vesicaria subsp. sativa]|nr:unnamed protein product [Eruca vesicaria subsp. sativa]
MLRSFRSINKIYDFYDERKRRFKIFTYPIASTCGSLSAVIDKENLCMQRGLSPNWKSEKSEGWSDSDQ